MSTTRIMSGLVDQTGREVNGLDIAGMVSRSPRPRYKTICKRCGAHGTADHDRITSGAVRCLSASCGRPVLSSAKRGATDMAASAAKLQREAEQASADASARRMEAETEGYTLPSRTLPKTLTQTPVRERDRLSARAHRDESEAAETAEREAQEKPIRDAEKALKETHRKLNAVERERLTGSVPDPDVYADPALASTRMTEAQAANFNRQQFRLFRDKHPDVYLTDGLLDQLGAYWCKQRLNLISLSMLERVIID